MNYVLRKATLDDRAALEALIARSARTLSAGDYTPRQIEAALRGTYGVDSQLIRDGTYFVAMADSGEIVGCGGWSRRRTMFGGDAQGSRDAAELDPHIDAAKMRAFFIDPGHARKGVGKAILERCEAEAIAWGFAQIELMATRPGVRLYQAFGYAAGEAVQHELEPGLFIEFVPMSKAIRN